MIYFKNSVPAHNTLKTEHKKLNVRFISSRHKKSLLIIIVAGTIPQSLGATK